MGSLYVRLLFYHRRSFRHVPIAYEIVKWPDGFNFYGRSGARSKCGDAALDGMHALGKMLLRLGSSLTNETSQFMIDPKPYTSFNHVI